MKLSFKNNLLNLFILLCSIFLIISFVISIASFNDTYIERLEKIDTYSFWNIIRPNEITIKKIKNFKNILKIKCLDEINIIKNETSSEEKKSATKNNSATINIKT